MKQLPFSIREELEGWCLFWAKLAIVDVDEALLAERRARVAEAARQRFSGTAEIGADPTVAALRKLFRVAGTDPTRYRPASEALLRRLVKGSELPAIQPLVDLNNCLSAELAVPCCVMVDGSFGSSLVWRSGVEGESYESLRGPFKLEGKPVLFDEEGPLDTPITGNKRVMVHPETESAWLVAYMPAAELELERAWEVLGGLCAKVGVEAEAFA
jgi:DNA/RNA-binding domain of Phe-tRNA-synthetase-like protein